MRGYVAVGGWAVRCDATDRALRELANMAQNSTSAAPPCPQEQEQRAAAIVSRQLECDEAQALAISRALNKLARDTKGRKKRRRRKRHTPAT